MEIWRRVVEFVKSRRGTTESDPRSPHLRTNHTDNVLQESPRSRKDAEVREDVAREKELVERPLVPIVRATQANGVTLWNLPYACSQSRLGGRMNPSSACTLIAVKLIENLERGQIRFPELRDVDTNGYPCSPQLVMAVVNAIIDGNSLHEKAMRKRRKRSPGTKYDTFSIPQAISACENCAKEIDYVSCGGSLRQFLALALYTAVQSPVVAECPRVYIVIVAFKRTTALVYDRETAGFFFFDSHSHQRTGAAICHSDWSDLFQLAAFVAQVIYPESLDISCRANAEVSVLHVRRHKKCFTNCHQGGIKPQSVFSSPKRLSKHSLKQQTINSAKETCAKPPTVTT